MIFRASRSKYKLILFGLGLHALGALVETGDLGALVEKEDLALESGGMEVHGSPTPEPSFPRIAWGGWDDQMGGTRADQYYFVDDENGEQATGNHSSGTIEKKTSQKKTKHHKKKRYPPTSAPSPAPAPWYVDIILHLVGGALGGTLLVIVYAGYVTCGRCSSKNNEPPVAYEYLSDEDTEFGIPEDDGEVQALPLPEPEARGL